MAAMVLVVVSESHFGLPEEDGYVSSDHVGHSGLCCCMREEVLG